MGWFSLIVIVFALICIYNKVSDIHDLVKYGTDDPQKIYFEKRKRGKI